MAAITAPVEVNVFNRGNRQAGIYTSASATIPEGIYSLGINDTMLDADASDPANRFTIWTEVSLDGVTWAPWGFHLDWEGGTFVHRQTGLETIRHIRTAWSNTDLVSGARVGWQVHAVIDQPQTLRVGFNVVAYPAGFNP